MKNQSRETEAASPSPCFYRYGQSFFSIAHTDKSNWQNRRGRIIMDAAKNRSLHDAAFEWQNLTDFPRFCRRHAPLYGRAVLETGQLSGFEKKARCQSVRVQIWSVFCRWADTLLRFQCSGGIPLAVPVVAFAAWSDTGKTTYLERLIPQLKEAGVRVGVLKHDGHGFALDTAGSDTDRLASAGADAVAIASPSAFAYMERRPVAPEDAVRHFRNVDLILAEGYKTGPFPIIALYRAASGKPLAVPAEACLAIVSDTPLAAPCPVLPLEDPAPMAAFLMQWMREQRGEHRDVSHP